MRKAELLEIIANGESSGVEFKRDDIRPEQLAKEIVALLNFKGGTILLGGDQCLGNYKQTEKVVYARLWEKVS